jgi:hypothetical protein
VVATVKNMGELPTQTARGATLAGNREDAIWLIGDRDKIRFLEGNQWTRIGVLDGAMAIPGYSAPAQPEALAGRGGRGGTPGAPGAPPQARGRGAAPEQQQVKGTGNTREITWLVAIEGDTPLKVVLTSQKGGTKVTELKVN